MKKTITMLLCMILLFVFFCPQVMAEEELTIISGTILNGDVDTEVSLLLKYKFSSEIKDLTVDEVLCKPTGISSVEVDGNELTIRLLHMMPYDTEHTLDLSLVSSVDGRKYKQNGGIIKFTTKYGESGKIYEDDFESGAPTILKNEIEGQNGAGEAVQKENDNGNWSYLMGKGTLTPSGVFQKESTISGKFIMEFDFLSENIASDYGFVSILGGNGLKGEEAKSFESRKLFMYDISENKFGVLYNKDTVSTNSSELHAGKVLNEGWNKIKAAIDLQNQSIELFVNGEQVEDGSGNKQFKFPCYSNASTADCKMNLFRLHKIETGHYGEGGGIYLDNLSLREVTAPFFAGASIKNGETVSLSCPDIQFNFKNFPKKLSLTLNGESINEENIVKNSDGSFTASLSLLWEESYTINGVIEGDYGAKREFSLNFTTGKQPSQLIEIEGFFAQDGRRLSEIESGKVTAKIKAWQNESKNYVFILSVHRDVDGRNELVMLSSSESVTTDSNLLEKEISVTVPEDTENCYVKIYALKSADTRAPYKLSLYSGKRVLK